jgi:hypothetical protein
MLAACVNPLNEKIVALEWMSCMPLVIQSREFARLATSLTRFSSGRIERVGSAYAGLLLAPWCNWLTRRPLKAESSGSIPDGATKESTT